MEYHQVFDILYHFLFTTNLFLFLILDNFFFIRTIF